jgi:hypothetical protein
VYVTGRTGSTGFPTASPSQATKLGVIDAFVAKLDARGSRLIYASYIGAPGGSSSGESIAVGPAGEVWIGLKTSALQFSVTSDLSTGTGSGAAVVMKLSPTGSPVWSTQLGNRFDFETGTVQMAVDTFARPVVVTAGAVIQLDTSGASKKFTWSIPGVSATDIVASIDGGTMISGSVDPNVNIELRNAWQTERDASGNGVVAMLDPNGVAHTISYVSGVAYYLRPYLLGEFDREAKPRWRIAADAQGTLHAAFSVVDLSKSPTGGATLPPNAYGPVSRTIDRGDSWTWSSQGLFGEVRSFAVDPARGYVYASMRAGIYRSVDHGDSWSLWHANEPGERADLIAVDPRDPATMYLFGPGPLTSTLGPGVGGCCVDFAPREAQVIRLDQDGRRRTVLRTLTTQCCEPESIEVSPHDGSVWLGANYALEASFDRGVTWVRRDQGLPPRGSGVAPPERILFDARRPGVVFEQSIYGVYRSTDNGLSWQNVFTTLARYGGANIPVGLGLDPLDSNHFFVSASAGGVYVTEDGGRNWQTPFGVIGRAGAIAVSPLLPFAVYTPYSYPRDKPPYDSTWTVAYSRDRGASWAAARRPPAPGYWIAPDPLDADRAFSVSAVYPVPLTMRMSRRQQQVGYEEAHLSTLPNDGVVGALAATADGQTIVGLNGWINQPRITIVLISR